MRKVDVVVKGWEQYKLLDSGNGRKLEEFNGVVTDRPDPQALWDKRLSVEHWAGAHAQFAWAQKGERWKIEKGLADFWNISYKNMILELSFPGFKHIGVFPEHSVQWDLIQEKAKKGTRMLNLFGYTGAATVAGAIAGLKVTHVDASKTTLSTVKKNCNLSGLDDDAVRTICEDALRYAKRLVERREQFEVIIMDPPSFGRGPKGEVWKIEESLSELIKLVPQLLSNEAYLVVLNGYASGYAARTFGELFKQQLPQGVITYGEVGIQEEHTDRILTTGIYAQWEQ